jgi:hypothetical protein
LKLLGKAPGEAPTRRYFEGLVRQAAFSAQHARQRLGWTPNADVSVLVEQGIHAAVKVRSTGAGR